MLQNTPSQQTNASINIRNYALGMLDERHAIKEKRAAFSRVETPEVTLVEASGTLAPLMGL